VIPNKEVRTVFYNFLYPAFFNLTYCPTTEKEAIRDLVHSIAYPEFPSLLEEFINKNV